MVKVAAAAWVVLALGAAAIAAGCAPRAAPPSPGAGLRTGRIVAVRPLAAAGSAAPTMQAILAVLPEGSGVGREQTRASREYLLRLADGRLLSIVQPDADEPPALRVGDQVVVLPGTRPRLRPIGPAPPAAGATWRGPDRAAAL